MTRINIAQRFNINLAPIFSISEGRNCSYAGKVRKKFIDDGQLVRLVDYIPTENDQVGINVADGSDDVNLVFPNFL